MLKQLRLSTRDAERLRALADTLELSEAAVMRQLIREKVRALELPDGAE